MHFLFALFALIAVANCQTVKQQPKFRSFVTVDFSGNDILNKADGGCEAICLADTNCKLYVEATDSKECWTKSGYSSIATNKLRKTFIKNTYNGGL